MSRVTFVFKNGKEYPLKSKLAEHLQLAGKGEIKVASYMTRVMVADTQPVHLTPAAKALAEDKGLDVNAIKGNGKDGAITLSDVKKAAERAE